MKVNPVQQIPFVNRLDELALIREKLQAIKNQKLFTFIITISGIPGIGKTTVLTQAEQEAKIYGINTVFVDYNSNTANNNPIYVLQKIADNFFKSVASWQKALKLYRDNQNNSEKIIRAFIENLKPQLERSPLLLLLDNSHRMDEATQEILEDVLERLSPYNKLLVILAGRSDIRWHSFELRRRTEAIILNSLLQKETAKLLPDPNYAELTDQVYAVTQGYPIASVLAYKWVTDNLKSSDKNLPRHFKEREAELIFNLFDSIFEEYILDKKHINDPLTRQRLGKLLRYVSPLRRFDDNLLATLLREVDKDYFAQVNTLDARAYTRQMSALTYLVNWESGKQAYALDRPLRHLLSLEMKFREKFRLLQIHQFAIDWYQKAIYQVTEKDPSAPQSVIYLLEQIFHLAQLWELESKANNLEITIREKIKYLFTSYTMRERVHFQEEFNKDEDLPELLGKIYSRLSSFVAQQVDSENQR